MITYYGKVIRNALILKNEDGIYDRVALYKSKKETEINVNVFYVDSWHNKTIYFDGTVSANACTLKWIK